MLFGALIFSLMRANSGWNNTEAGIAVGDDAAHQSGPFPLPPGARLESAVAYGPHPRQHIDIYHPAAPDHAPVIVMVHGGGWSMGNSRLWRVVKNKVAHWVGKGYIFVSVNYRMSPEADPIAQADDVAMALAFVAANFDDWAADPDRLVLMGHSSGAHLVSLLNAVPELTSRRGVKPWRATVALDSAAMNVEGLMGRRHLPMYDSVFGTDPAYWREASPTLRLLGAPVTPMLIVCSSQRMDSCAQAQGLAMRIVQFGGRAEVLPVDKSHPQINGELGTACQYTADTDAFFKSVGMP